MASSCWRAQSTETRTPGRFFFIWMGWNQTSAAPAASKRSCT